MKISEIIIKPSINPRKKLRNDIIEYYADILDKLPPVIVQKGTHILIDGFHRIAAAKHAGIVNIAAEEIDILDSNLFAEACKRNNAHGLQLNCEERNEAIVKLYKEGWKQKALAEMWGLSESQIFFIAEADKRSSTLPGKVKLSPKHEQIIRRAPELLQDKIAEVVLTREAQPKQESGELSKRQKRLTVAQTNSLVKEALENPNEISSKLDYLIEHPKEDRIIGIDDRGDIEKASIEQIIASVKSEPDIVIDWAELMLNIAQFKARYNLTDVAKYIIRENHGYGIFSIENAINYFESILSVQTFFIEEKTDEEQSAES